MKFKNKMWLGAFFASCVVFLSCLHEFRKVTQTTEEYLARWDDELAETYLQKSSHSLLDKILIELEKNHVVVIEALPGEKRLQKVPSRFATFSYPLAYYGLPVGQMTFAISIFELLRRVFISPELFVVLMVGLTLLFFGSKMTLRDYQRTLHQILERIEDWAERGISFEEQATEMKATERRICRWIEKGCSLEAERRRLSSDLEHERRWSDLSRQVVHDLRAPLSIFEDLRTSGRANPALLSLAAERMKSVIRDLHQSSLTGHRKLVSVQSLQACLRQTLELNQHGLSPSYFQIKTEMATEDPQALVVADDEGLARLFQNLIANAIESHRSRSEIRVDVVIHRDHQKLSVTITDAGRGIPQSLLAQLGTPGMTSKVNGTGLGLFGAQHLMSRWGGTLSIRSTPFLPVGTEVTLMFLMAE